MTVALVGAGPGDPGLLTRRGAELLALAEVVVYDRLVASQLLQLAPDGAELIDVGKAAGAAATQQSITERLVDLGRAGRRVVRLKGGDPYVFGRGGEEAEALVAAGIEFEVVPGVSSAFAVPAAAGIPVTHRGMAGSVTVVTGTVGSAGSEVDWEALGRSGSTLVVLMGVAERSRITGALLAAGRPPVTPVAAVRWGTTDREEVVRTTLDRLPEVGLAAPVVIVIGPVAALDLRPGAAGPAGGVDGGSERSGE
ncbi:MAG: uroporphyrinogen-III C-methyltransferase [Acidimicrobiales bacterium]